MKLYAILHSALHPLMMATEGQEEEGAGGLPEGVSIEGATTRAVGERPAPVDPDKKERPEGLPESFDTWEAYAKSLEKPTPEAKEPPAKEEPKPGETPKAPTEEELAAAVAETVNQWPEAQREAAKPFVEEFAKTGTLSEASVKAASEAFGVPEFAVRQYMAGAETEALKAQVAGTATQAEVDAANAPILATFGGQEGWDKFSEWANENLSDDQRDAYNEALAKTPKAALEMSKTYAALWGAAGNDDPKDLTGGVAGEAAEKGGYATEQEWKADMADPRYSIQSPVGEAFRQKVYAKLGRSKFE